MKRVYFWATMVVCAVMALTFSSCDDDDEKGGDDTIIGTDPSSIAKGNLVAYLPLNDEKVSIGDLTLVKNEKITFVEGQRGKAYQGVDGGYMQYKLPANSKLKSLKALSIACWAKMLPNPANDPDTEVNENDPESWLCMLDGEDAAGWQGNFYLKQNRNAGPDGSSLDTATMTCQFYKQNSAEWKNQGIGGLSHGASLSYNKWQHIICTYDNATSEFSFYHNGIKVPLPDGSRLRWQGPEEGDNRILLGDLQFAEAENLYLGALAWHVLGLQTDAWIGYYKGQMDELRIYDRALTNAEVVELYQAELAQTPEE